MDLANFNIRTTKSIFFLTEEHLDKENCDIIREENCVVYIEKVNNKINRPKL